MKYHPGQTRLYNSPWEGINIFLEDNAHVEYLVVSPASFVRTLPSCLTAIKNWYMDIEASIATFLPGENNQKRRDQVPQTCNAKSLKKLAP